jgi:hypothetical protein
MTDWKFSTKTPTKSNWAGIMAKAQRLRLTDGVHIEEKEDGYTSGTVEGDHGTYHVQMLSHDPYSGIIDEWQCECPWFQYAFDRTEKYQKFEGRFCSHALALYWQAAVEEPTKTPEEAAPEEERDEKPVVEEELKWEMEEPEVAEEIALEDPERLAPREIEGPKVVSEIAPPTEPGKGQPQEIPANIEEIFPWAEVQEEEENPELPIGNVPVPNIQNMSKVITLKDMLKFKQTN